MLIAFVIRLKSCKHCIVHQTSEEFFKRRQDLALHFFPRRLPWDQQAVFGFLGEMFYILAVALAYYFANGTFLVLLVSICMHHRAFYKMFKMFVRELDELDSARRQEEMLCHVIHFHVTVKE